MSTPSIAAGWESYRKMIIPATASSVQIEECHRAFYAGAAILFESIMRMLDPGEEPTDADMARMSAIDKELRDFGRGLDAEVFSTHPNVSEQ